MPADSKLKDWRINMVAKQALGYRLVISVGSERRIEEVVLEALPQIGVGMDEMFELVLRPVKEK